MPPPLVIDTSAITDQNFRYWLYNYRGEKILPMVAFVELSVFLQSRHKSKGQIMELLRRSGISIQPFGQAHANRAVETAIAAGDFKKNWRDHMIGGHAHTAPMKLITYNVVDFKFLGPRVMTPQQAMQEL